MRVIENKIEKEMICPHCGSHIAYDSEDITSLNGKEWIYCGACGEEINLEKSVDCITPDLKPPFFCDKCRKEFNTLPHIGADGSLFATCPKCNNEVWVGEGIELNPQNIEYPKHFYTYNNEDTVIISDKRIQEWVREAAAKLDKDNDYYFTGAGDTLVIAVKADESVSECTIYVCKGYSECNFKISKEKF